jgi:hypothetical protein
MNKLPRMALYFTSSTKQMHKAGPSSVKATAKEPIGQAGKVASHTHSDSSPQSQNVAQGCPGWRVELFVRHPHPLDCIDAFLQCPIGKKLAENRGRKLVGR